MVSLLYLLVIFVWWICTWYIFGEWSSSNSEQGLVENILQRALTAIPVLKLIQTLIYGMYAGQCPWEDQVTARYTMMALVTVSTLYQTMSIALLLLISKGWVIIRGSLDREEAMNVLMIMAAVYLSCSTFYVSIGIERLQTLIAVSMNLLYLIIYSITLKNATNVVSTLKQYLATIGLNN
jgi:hypothetical protein